MKVTGENSKYESSGLIYVGDDGQGTLEVSNGGFVSSTSDTHGVFISSNGTLIGDGYVSAIVVANLGVIAPIASANSLTVGSILGNDPGGTIRMTIESANSYSSLTVVGGLVLNGGTLAVEFAEGFEPSSSMSFDFLDWLTLIGTFSAITLPNVPEGFSWDTTQLYINGVVSLTGAFTAPGDFDADGDVDGRDFLLWQRDPGIGNLADWQANYGTGSLSAAVSVPEPSFGALWVCTVLLCGCRPYRK